MLCRPGLDPAIKPSKFAALSEEAAAPDGAGRTIFLCHSLNKMESEAPIKRKAVFNLSKRATSHGSRSCQASRILSWKNGNALPQMTMLFPWYNERMFLPVVGSAKDPWRVMLKMSTEKCMMFEMYCTIWEIALEDTEAFTTSRKRDETLC
jgi:hypothetical protein